MRRILFVTIVLTLSLLTIACNSKKSVEPELTATQHVQFIRDYEYEYPRIIDLGTPAEVSLDDSIVTLLVYYQEEINRSPEARYAWLRTNPAGAADAYDRLETMVEMEPDQYTFFPGGQGRFGHTIVFRDKQSRYRALGAFYIVHRKDGIGNLMSIDTIGNIISDTLTLKQLYDGLYDDPANPNWDLMWRNCYRMPLGLPLDDLTISLCQADNAMEDTSAADGILKPSADTTQQWPFITVTGLDQSNLQGQKLPDGLVDESEVIFRPDWGLLVFPHRRPFDTDTVFVSSFGVPTPPLELLVPELYSNTSQTQRASASKYYLQLQWVTWD